MSFPLLGFIAQVTLFAFPLCWLLRFLEKRIVGVRSDFWDSFLASFLSLIGTVVINLLIMIALYQLPWGVTDLIWALQSFALWLLLTHKLLKLEPRHARKISITMVAVLYAIDWLLYWIGFGISVTI